VNNDSNNERPHEHDFEKITELLKTHVATYRNSNSLSLEPCEARKTLLNDVVKCRIHDADKQSDIYVKFEKVLTEGESLQDEFNNIIKFRSLFDSTKPQFDCVEPLFYNNDHPTVLVLKECAGDNVLDIIDKGCRWFTPAKHDEYAIEAAEAMGRWLNHLETASLGIEKPIDVYNRVKKSAENAGEKIYARNSGDAAISIVKSCLKDMGGAMEKMKEMEDKIYLAHGDFHPGNFFAVGKQPGITAIDFQLARPQFVGYDALYFEQALLMSFGPSKFSPYSIRKILDAFWQGYNRSLDDPLWLKRLLKSQLVLRALIYLSTISQTGGVLRRFVNLLDIYKLRRWLM